MAAGARYLGRPGKPSVSLAAGTAKDRGRGPGKVRNVALVTVLFHTAIRVSELVSLRLDQVDLSNRLLLDVRVKGDRHSSVAFNDVVAEALERYLAVRSEFRHAASSPALFLSQRGHQLSVRAVQELAAKLGEDAGMSRSVTPHLLRHSSVTQLVELGTPMRVVQEIRGHASIRTAERYAHVSQGQRRNALTRLGASWRKAESERKKRLTGEE